jgi:chemotaxis protein CheD
METVFLQPGEVAFGDHEVHIQTILGSCVAVTFWHPWLRLGGMCHYMLSERTSAGAVQKLDGRYAGDALELLLAKMTDRGTRPVEYEVKMFGGGNQFPSLTSGSSESISERNVSFGKELLASRGFVLKSSHLGGFGHRNIIFDISTGQVWVRFVQAPGEVPDDH